MASKADERFPRSYRIDKSSVFRSLYSKGKRYDAGSFVLFGQPNTLGHHRLGLTVSRKVGCAVVRNRIKRVFREVFRRAIADIPSHFDFVVNARRACAGAAYALLFEEFVSAARRICR